jgi:predicted CxxxxCH...CXXCH cytochrome family protein
MVTGHNRPSGNYASGNVSAARTCDECHDLAIGHISGTDNTTYGGNRLLSTVNGNATGGTVTGLCEACHTTTGTSPATKKSVNSHGNAGYADRLEAVFTKLDCSQCHEAHGLVYVSTGTTGVNLWMISPTITVTGGTTVSPVRLFAKTDANSFNEYDPGSGNEGSEALYNANAADQLCVVCHANANNPGYQMTYNISGRHAAPNYTGNEAGKDCSGCHSHNQDGDIGTVDGLMPLACNGCHSYPGLDNAGVNLKQMSGGHWKHVGQPSPVGTGSSREFACTLCHYNYAHNQSGVASGQAWPGTYYDNVNIDFDPSWNPDSPTYAGSAVPTTGNGGTGVCAGLYCHGGNPTRTAGWSGTDNTPSWNGSAACGACHVAGSGFTPENHPAHLSAAYGPGIAAFSVGGDCSEGAGCHPKYALTPLTTHVNNAKDLRSTATDNGEVGASLAATQVCRNCHSTTASSEGTGDTLVRTQANWDNTSYKVPCLTCHNDGAQGTQNIDGSGDAAPNIDNVWASVGHGAASIDNSSTTTDSGNVDQVPPVRCETCHDETGQHIGTAKDGTNPWRLDGALTNYTQTGGLDDFCLTQCHSQAALPPRHARIVNGTWGVAKDSALHTHPTAMQVVPQPGAPSGETVDKSRWFNVPSDTAKPLSADLGTKSPPARTDGSLMACVTCHDPHGAGTALISPRTFSGMNTMGAGAKKMLRYNPSGAQPTPLCSKCHK